MPHTVETMMGAAMESGSSSEEDDDGVDPAPVVQLHPRWRGPPVEQADGQDGSSKVDPYATESDDESNAVDARQVARTQAKAEEDRLDFEADALRQLARAQAKAEQDRLDLEAFAADAARQLARAQAKAEQDRLDLEAFAALATRQLARTQAKAEQDRLDLEQDAVVERLDAIRLLAKLRKRKQRENIKGSRSQPEPAPLPGTKPDLKTREGRHAYNVAYHQKRKMDGTLKLSMGDVKKHAKKRSHEESESEESESEESESEESESEESESEESESKESESKESESEEEEDSEETSPKKAKKGCGGKADGATDEKPRPHVCEKCDKTFSDVRYLAKHMRVHTGSQPYLCKTCGKKFSRSDNLATHMRIHTGSQPYLCKTCGKKFSDASNLATHIKRLEEGKGCGGKHLGEKPHVCACGFACSRKCNLARHMLTHLKSAKSSEAP
jgi:DNA-directed RNA polymerase subunit RPC12/RpoP